MPVPVGESPHGWARLAAAVAGALSGLQGAPPSAAAESLFARYDAHDTILEREWPDIHSSASGEGPRDRALARREKSLRILAHQTAVSGWISILLKLSPVVLTAGLTWRLFGG
jgi:hypothetical protein